MNNDLISRKDLIATIEDVDWYHINDNGDLVWGANSDLHMPLYKSKDIYEALEDAPAVDAVEVVYCAECKYWNDGKCRASAVDDILWDETDFCSYGERRGDI